MKSLNLFELASFYNDVNYCFHHYKSHFNLTGLKRFNLGHPYQL